MSFDPPPVPNIALPKTPAVAPTPAPTFGSGATPGSKPQAKPSQPTFLGAGLTAAGTQLSRPSLIGSFGG